MFIRLLESSHEHKALIHEMQIHVVAVCSSGSATMVGREWEERNKFSCTPWRRYPETTTPSKRIPLGLHRCALSEFQVEFELGMT